MSPYCEWCAPLRRTFSRYPAGWAGVALLSMRVTVGAIVLIEGATMFAGSPSTLQTAAATSALLAGLALLFGVLTPVASALIAAEAAAVLLLHDSTALRLLDSRIALGELTLMASVLAILGPGALSIDARLFGLREVTISGNRRPDES